MTSHRNTSNFSPSVPLLLLFPLPRTPSHSTGSDELYLFCQTQLGHHIFHEHPRMTLARSDLSLLGATPGSVPAHLMPQLILMSPISPGRQRAPGIFDKYLRSTCSVAGIKLRLRPRTRHIDFALMECGVYCRGQSLKKLFPRYLIPIVMRFCLFLVICFLWS